jgi:TonB family protein
MAPTEDTFHADPEERPPPLASSIEPNRWLALAGATLVYTFMFVGLTVDYRFAPSPEPVPQEIPVEIVPEPEPLPPPPPPRPQEQEYLEPAHDAPRVAKTKGTDGDVAEKSEKSPSSPAEVRKPATEKSAAAAKEDTKAPDLEPPTPDDPPAPVADGETPPMREARADPKPPAEAPAHSESSGVVFHFADPGAEVVDAIMTPGLATLIYTTHLYGLILPQRHLPAGPPPRSFNPEGATIDFILDGKGRLTDRRVAYSSGWREFDAACVDSLAKASPSFPPPPQSKPVALVYHCCNAVSKCTP